MRKILVSALAAAVLVVLFASAQGTAALWRAEESLDPGSLTTGTLKLEVGDAGSTAQEFSFAALFTSTLAPGGFVQAPLTIRNAGSTPLGYTLAGATSATSIPTAADTALAAAVELSVYSVACSLGGPSPDKQLYKGPLAITATFEQPRELAGNGSSETLCVRVGLPASAQKSVAGGSLKLVLAWRGDQP